MKLTTLIILLTTSIATMAADQWSVLAEFESGSDDSAVGRSGERSCIQILPKTWRTTTSWPLSYATSREHAVAVGQKIMADRVAAYTKSHKQAPSILIWYVLWNAPAQADKPSRVVLERAQRFTNLYIKRTTPDKPGVSYYAKTQPTRNGNGATRPGPNRA